MSVARSTLTRSLQIAARRAPVAAPLAIVRTYATESKSLKPDVVAQKSVPVTAFKQDGKNTTTGTSSPLHFDIPVGAAKPVAESTEEAVTPLNQALYAKLPVTLQRMTVMGKVVIVTGGARGLGNHMARACAEAGAKAICIFDANQELGDESAAELHNLTGLPVRFYKVDVRDGQAINDAVSNVVEVFGAPDVLINSAGIADSNLPAENYDHAMFRRLIDINLTGSFLMCQAVGNAMMAAGKPGSLVLVASMSGSIVNYPQEQSCYNASKAGVIQLSKSLAAEWAKYNIRVNSISPGYMDTALNNVPALDAQKKVWVGMTPQARLGAVDDLNGLAVFLASDASAYMTGADVIIDGGYTLY